MEKRKYFIFFISIISIYFDSNAQSIEVSSGTIKRFENFKSKYVDARNIDVWLPAKYNAKNKYAVLYMQDGQMLFDSTHNWNHQEWGVDETITKLLSENKIKDCIVVGIWNNGNKRDAEYFPQKAFYNLSDSNQQVIRNYVLTTKQRRLFGDAPIGDLYLKFLVTELKPFIDSSFSVYTNQQNTFIGGSSRGGLISMYAICEYPEVFGGAGCLSTHWSGVYTNQRNMIPEIFYTYLSQHLPSPKTHKIYFDYGSLTLDSLYKPYQLKVDEIMKQKGYNSSNWITKEFPGENHSEKSWSKRLYIPILFLLKK